MKKIIGTAEIEYDENGVVVNAGFKPVMELVFDESMKKLLKASVQGDEKEEEIQHNADMILASWFSQISDVELAERDEQEIVSEIVGCEKFDSGKIKICRIQYTFQDVVRTTASA